MAELPARQCGEHVPEALEQAFAARLDRALDDLGIGDREVGRRQRLGHRFRGERHSHARLGVEARKLTRRFEELIGQQAIGLPDQREGRSEEHTSELQSLMRISYAVFCLKKKTLHTQTLYCDYSSCIAPS